jgi:2-amino-4-hydroxy-6-hydroxymethyldihydropteridine diphosphokinase
MQKTVYLSLGSNTGEREKELQTAIEKLVAPDFEVRRISHVYETAPVDYKDQAHFLNCVVEARTAAFPMRLLARINAIETEMGRRRTIPKGPRNIDIDILLFGKFVVDTPKLVIPHAHMAERRFVLEPLVELAPDLRHPVTRQTIKEILAAAPHQFVRRTALRLTLPGRLPEERA